MMSVVIGAFL